MTDIKKKEICPITDGTCNRKCGFSAHITITRARKNIINRLSVDERDIKK